MAGSDIHHTQHGHDVTMVTVATTHNGREEWKPRTIHPEPREYESCETWSLFNIVTDPLQSSMIAG